jgi:hypothetical protein
MSHSAIADVGVRLPEPEFSPPRTNATLRAAFFRAVERGSLVQQEFPPAEPVKKSQ